MLGAFAVPLGVLGIMAAVALTMVVVIEVVIQSDDFFNTMRAYKAAKQSDVKTWKVKSKTWVNSVSGQRRESLDEVNFEFDDRKYDIELECYGSPIFLRITHGWVPLGSSASYDTVGKTGPIGAFIMKQIKKTLVKRSKIILDIHKL